MRNPKPRGSRLSSRPFYTTVLFITLLATYSLFLRVPGSNRQDVSSLLTKKSEHTECRDLHYAKDKCAFVQANCADDEAGLLSYLTLYYCDLGNAHPVAFIILVLWLGLLFTTIGIAASDFFSVNLSTIASILGLSESLAGVTFLAFGNGSPDVFSTFAAMGSNSASMAVGELIGAASFITAVVAGSMALVREFKVGRKTFVRDICFFIVAVAFTMFFLADGHLHLWECITMIGYYLFYVITVVGWHWYSTRRRQRREREAAARGHVYGAVANGNDELAPDPYRDDPDDDTDRQVSSAGANGADLSALEAGPRIEIDGYRQDEEDDEDSDRGKHLAAEMASSMRVLRPRGRRSTTMTPIRPSLVGALEFRSALAQLQRERNLRLGPVNGRAYSDNHLDGIQSEAGRAAATPAESSRHTVAITEGVASGRERALSSGNIPPSFSDRQGGIFNNVRDGSDGSAFPFHHPGRQGPGTRSPSPSFQIGGSLAPPPVGQHPARQDTSDSEQAQPPVSPRLLQLQIPTSRRGSTSDRGSPVSPFPGFTDSPTLLTPNPQSEPTEFMLPGPGRLESPFPDFAVRHPRPVRWWPYAVLPPPHILLGILFPTLQGWGEKSIWDKFVSAISVPSIFLLVITLPVVETETPDDLSDETAVNAPERGSIGNSAAPVSVEPDVDVEHETEWQQYRRSTRAHSVRSSQTTSPLLIALDSPNQTHLVVPDMAPPTHQQQVKPGPPLPSESDGQADDASAGWNRWLVALQLFTGPLFAVFILWANWREDFEQPGRMLVKLVLYTLLGSTILLAVLLLTTTPDRRPKYHLLLCFMGFIISIAWISTIAGEVVGVLKTLGVILGISEALLGLTIFAAGNSIGDLIADITVARLGYPVMALSACFGGPMLNILLGIGIGGVWMMTQAANHKHSKHPDRPFKYEPYEIRIGGTLMVSAITLLITLVGLLIAVPMNKWVMSRKIGWTLIVIWTVSTIINVIVELTGVLVDIS